MFENKKGLDIFQEWIDKIGQFDEEDIIGIRIIEEIDKKHPYWYRVCIGSNLMSGIADGKNHVFISKIRLHTMNPANNINLHESGTAKIVLLNKCFNGDERKYVEPNVFLLKKEKNTKIPYYTYYTTIISNVVDLLISKPTDSGQT